MGDKIIHTPADLPPAPAEEDQADPHCETCSSLFHSTEDHPAEPPVGVRGVMGASPVSASEFPPGYDPGEADRLIGRTPRGA